jgi:class 3 adenylate cyclase
MTAPTIRYVRSADGTNIAYSTLGEGRPLVFVGHPGNLFTFDSEWRIPRVRRSMEQFAGGRMFVRTDPRGRGLSDRDITDRSFEAHLADLLSVVDALSPEPVDLMASGISMVSAFAAKHPERVRKAIISLTLPLSFRMSPLRKKLGELAAIDFDFYKQALALRNFGWTEGRIAAEQMRELTLEELNSGYRDTRGWDDSTDLSSVRCPVLVVHRRGAEVDVPLDDSRRLASSLPNGELRIVDASGTTMFDEQGLVTAAIVDFLDGHESASEPATQHSGTAIILFADIADSTALTERMGDAGFRAAATALDEGIRRAMHQTNGTPVDGKVLGDGVMGVFSSAAQAIEAARRCVAASAMVELPLHIGIHAGDVIREPGNVFGGTVNIASRVCGLCHPGEILVSQTVRDLARTSAGATFVDRGEHALKGIADTVRVFAVQAS